MGWEDRAIAAALAHQGEAAIPELDRALDDVTKRGENSRFFQNGGWLAFAYARILGTAAVPRFRGMERRPGLVGLGRSLDQAVALSLGITSYVSSFGWHGSAVICRRGEPRDALDQLIFSLERNDRSQFESSLGPDARSALGQMLDGKSWESVRREFWHERPLGQGAVGYAFDIPGRWSEPEETLQASRGDEPAPVTSQDFGLDTQFKAGDGGDCARFTVKFRRVLEPTRADSYLVNNSDLAGLMRAIGGCFAQ